jgi:hypothetical protein
MSARAVSFAADIRPLFRAKDVEAMKRAFDLSKRDDVAANADAIYGRLRAGTMPCDGAWPDENVALFAAWISGGKKP